MKIGAVEGGFTINEDVIFPESDIGKSLNKKNVMAYKVVLDDKMVGGAIVVINQDSKTGYLDFLYVKHGMQGKSIGKFMWSEIERLYPEIKVWEDYFDKEDFGMIIFRKTSGNIIDNSPLTFPQFLSGIVHFFVASKVKT